MRRGIGLTTGFIKHSYNTWLHFTVPCNTHAPIFLVLMRSHVLSPLSVVASSAESLLFTANCATTVAASAGSLYSPAGTYSLAATPGSRRLRLLHSTAHSELTGLTVKVKVMLRPTTSRSVSPGFKAHVGFTTGTDHKENTVSDSSTVAWRHYRNGTQIKHRRRAIVACVFVA
jgi:hypothetical protein